MCQKMRVILFLKCINTCAYDPNKDCLMRSGLGVISTASLHVLDSEEANEMKLIIYSCFVWEKGRTVPANSALRKQGDKFRSSNPLPSFTSIKTTVLSPKLSNPHHAKNIDSLSVLNIITLCK